MFSWLTNELLYLLGGMRGGTMTELDAPPTEAERFELYQRMKEQNRAQAFAQACAEAERLRDAGDG